MLKRHMKQSDQQIFQENQSDIKKYVNSDQFKLYDLIWSRALSSQMNPAEFIEIVLLFLQKMKKLILELMDQLLNLMDF